MQIILNISTLKPLDRWVFVICGESMHFNIYVCMYVCQIQLHIVFKKYMHDYYEIL